MKTYFTGEKEENMPKIRNVLADVIDIWGKRDNTDTIGYFKKKWLKSKLIAEDIEDLKGQEECDKNKHFIKNYYKYNDKNSQNRLSREDYFDLENDEKLDLEKFSKLFTSVKDNEFKFIIMPLKQSDVLL